MFFFDNFFDVVYVIEVIVYVFKFVGVYSEIYRVFKFGGKFGVYEWLMIDKYDNNNFEYRDICFVIEEGDGIFNMVIIFEGIQVMKDVGFNFFYYEDFVKCDDFILWYWGIVGEIKYMQLYFDFFIVFCMIKVGCCVVYVFIGFLEMVGFVFKGIKKMVDVFVKGVDGFVVGVKKDFFILMYFMIGQKFFN